MKVQRLFLPSMLCLAGCSASAGDFQCPLPESGTNTDSLRETSQQIAASADQLGTGTAAEISDVIAGVRTRHPGASQTAVVNYLVSAYCPKIKANSALDRAQKRDAMMTFSRRVERLARTQ